MPDAADRIRRFRQLHESGCFVIPNPWDVGSARVLAGLGFPALASSSSGFAWSQAGREAQSSNADPRPLPRDVGALLPEAIERALSLGYDIFKAQVVPYRRGGAVPCRWEEPPARTAETSEAVA